MRFVISILFLVTLVACLYAEAAAFKGTHVMASLDITDPLEMAHHFWAAIYGRAVCGLLVAVTLLMMTVDALLHRGWVRGAFSAIPALLAGTVAVVSILDVGVIANDLQNWQVPQAGEVPHQIMVPLLGRLPSNARKLSATFSLLDQSRMRVQVMLFLLGLGTTLTLFSRRPSLYQTSPPPIGSESGSPAHH